MDTSTIYIRFIHFIFFFLVLSLGTNHLWGQTHTRISLELRLTDKDSSFLSEHGLTSSQIYNSKEDITQELANIRKSLAHQAYITNTIDSLIENDSTTIAFLTVGEAYKWATLEKGNVDEIFLNRIGFKERLFSNKPFYYTELIDLLDKLQVYAENNGYPFAIASLDSIQFVDRNSISATLSLEKNQIISYEGVEIVGEGVKISKRYLESYLGIEEGDLYSLEKIKEIPNRIRELPFLKEVQPLKVTFRGSRATIHLFLEKRKASKFDFLVGVLPRNEVTKSRLLITLDGMFSTQNLLGGGEKIFLEFRQPRPSTQKLDLELGYPYIFGLPFGVDFDFSLYKRDSTFIDVEYDGGFSYLFGAQHYIKAFGHSKRSILLEVDTTRVLNTRSLPENLDTKFTDFGLEYHISQLDYKFNPRKGWALTTRAAAGFRSVEINSNISNLIDSDEPSFDFASLYDTLDTRTFQYQLDTKIEYFIPFYPTQRGVFKLSNQTSAMISPQPVFLNEQYRIGGTKVIRGFDEEGIVASLYSIFTLEYRFLLSRNSYLSIFGDYGYTESKLPTGKITDTPLGFGLGMTFDTKVGVFGINYAYGKQMDNPINFRAAKIHFGYINYF